MKKKFQVIAAALFFCSGLVFTGCEQLDNNGDGDDTLQQDTLPQDTLPQDTLPQDTLPQDTLPQDSVKSYLLTFEDSDYKGEGNYLGQKNWSSLIDNPEYGGPLLYGDTVGYDSTYFEEYGYVSPIYGGTKYSWCDENNTGLCSQVNESYGSQTFFNGGIVISNYVNSDYAAYGSYFNQLTSMNGGYDGSKNFAISNGLSTLAFENSEAHTIDSIFVNSTTYGVNSSLIGGYASAFIPESWIKITATGYVGGVETKKSEFYLAKEGVILTEWKSWNLSELGAVESVTFEMSGSDDQNSQYGLNFPAYFAIDNIAVSKGNL